MTSNRATLNDVTDTGIANIIGLPADQLAFLIGEAAEALDPAKRIKDRLDGTPDLQYAVCASVAPAACSKAAGTVRFKDGGFVVIANLPKRVKWDQQRRAAAVEIIRRDWNDDSAPYVRAEWKVAERAYGTGSVAIRRLFERVRTLETGKPAYRIEPAGKEVA